MDVLQEAQAALDREPAVMVATILHTTGSTPASAFSKMLITHGGTQWLGTVGGGCVEGDVLEAARAMSGNENARIMTFHLNDDDLIQGLICGGSLDVLIETFTGDDRGLLRDVTSRRSAGEDCVVASFLIEKKIVKRLFFPHPSGREDIHGRWRTAGLPVSDAEAEGLADATVKAGTRNETQRVHIAGGEIIIEPLAGFPHVIIFGGGHVSKAISRTATMSGFQVTVVDDRREYANAERFPEAVKTIVAEFHDVCESLAISRATYIVIVTRGHRSDEDVLAQVINSDARYIGMIGSKRKVLTTYERLVERGIPADAIRRVHAPMGLEIGAVTPEEIAVSIVAQLIRVRRGIALPLRNKSDIMDDLIRNLAGGKTPAQP
jgi:xanthine dehydrogenase accessory factor